MKSNTRSLSSGLNFTRSAKLAGSAVLGSGDSSVLRSFVRPALMAMGAPISLPLASLLATVAEKPVIVSGRVKSS